MQLRPLQILHVKHNHFVVEYAALTLPSVDDHALLVHRRAVILPGSS